MAAKKIINPDYFLSVSGGGSGLGIASLMNETADLVKASAGEPAISPLDAEKISEGLYLFQRALFRYFFKRTSF